MPEQSQNLVQSQQLRQEQIIAPQQIQSLEILLAPLLELQARISQELAENPVLEQEKPAGGEELAGDIITENSDAEEKKDDTGETDEGRTESLKELIQLADSWQNYLAPSHSRRVFTEDDEEKRRYFFESITEEPSLQEQLLDQLHFTGVDDKMKELAELIIGSIDERGYLRSHLADLATAGGGTVHEMEKALKLVQSFDPPGIAARNLKECLLLQLKAKGKSNSLIYKMIENHLDDIAGNRIPSVARKMRVSLSKLQKMLKEIRKLNPNPGLSLAQENPVFIIPEATVEKRDGKYVVISKDDSLPKLRISQFYLNLLENPNTAVETKEYIKNKLLQGKTLIRSLEQRKDTIRQIAEVIVDSQYDFLEKGVEYLHPMTMQQVADKLNIHETTVSRAISNKFIQTPSGILEFKFFFSTGFHSDNGEEISNKSVMEKIQDMIGKEDTSNPLSDKDIAEKLKSIGLSVARRTVAKYREELNILPSRLRKEF